MSRFPLRSPALLALLAAAGTAVFLCSRAPERLARQGEPPGQAPSFSASARPAHGVPHPKSAPPGDRREAFSPDALLAEIGGAWRAGDIERACERIVALAAGDLPSALEAALGIPTDAVSSDRARALFRDILALDPERAISWVEARGGGAPVPEPFWAAGVDTFAGTDPARALDLARRATGENRFYLVRDVFAEWAGEDVAAAQAAALALEDPADRQAASASALREALSEDFASAMRWVESVGDPLVQDTLYLEALPEWAAADPRGAAGFAGDLDTSDYKTVAAGKLAGAWAASAPDAAVKWASSLPDQESREEGIRKALETAGAASRALAADLALGIVSEDDRWGAIERVVHDWAGADPPAATAWAARIADPATRERVERILGDSVPAR